MNNLNTTTKKDLETLNDSQIYNMFRPSDDPNDKCDFSGRCLPPHLDEYVEFTEHGTINYSDQRVTLGYYVEKTDIELGDLSDLDWTCPDYLEDAETGEIIWGKK